ncbi:MAG: TolB family protein [Bacteroidia bacterium]
MNLKLTKFVLLLFLFAVNTLLAQYKTVVKIVIADKLPSNISLKEERFLNNVVVHLQNANYLRALPFTDSLLAERNDCWYYQYLQAICYSYSQNHLKKSLEIFNQLKSYKDSLEDYSLFYANLLWNLEDFENSYITYKQYLNESQSLIEYKDFALNRIFQYETMLEQKRFQQQANIRNIGATINTVNFEYAPVINSAGNRLYFTYRGEKSVGGKQITPGVNDDEKGVYYEDIFYSDLINDSTWSEPQPIKELNTIYHEALLSISQDEKTMFLYRNTSAGTGDIYFSKFTNGKWSNPEKLKGEVNTSSWEGSAFLSPDGKYLYFSSERPGGYGGKDLYRAKLIDGKWKKVENLGPTINTKADEDSPVLFGDGKILFFSSNGHRSMGGFDLFRADLVEGKWQEPINVGIPINTTKDDVFFTITADGSKAYISSDRKGTIGKQDIYEITPGLIGKPTRLLILSGIVKYNFEPVESKILINSTLNPHISYEPIYTNNKGEFTFTLPAQDEFNLNFYVNDSTLISKKVSTAVVDTISKLFIEIDFLDSLLQKEFAITDDKIQKLKGEFEDFNINSVEIIPVLKNKLDDLYFSIQIGAYKDEENFDLSKFINLDKIARIYDKDDKLIRFFIGKSDTIFEAFEKLNEIKNRKIQDAFIVAFYKNKRISFNEAVNLLSESLK